MGCCVDNIDERVKSKVVKKLNPITIKVVDITKKRKNIISQKMYRGLNINEISMNFAKDAMEINNKYRKSHQVKPLIFDEFLYKNACFLAKQLLTEGTYDNKFLKYIDSEEVGFICLKNKGELTPQKLMKIWYEESIKENYNYIEPKELECNNFTQMVWRNSQSFGLGYHYISENEEIKNQNLENNSNENSKDDSEKVKTFYYVALYYPEGNKPGEYKFNVLRPIINSISFDNDENGEAENKNKEQNPEARTQKMEENGGKDENGEAENKEKKQNHKTKTQNIRGKDETEIYDNNPDISEINALDTENNNKKDNNKFISKINEEFIGYISEKEIDSP